MRVFLFLALAGCDPVSVALDDLPTKADDGATGTDPGTGTTDAGTTDPGTDTTDPDTTDTTDPDTDTTDPDTTDTTDTDTTDTDTTDTDTTAPSCAAYGLAADLTANIADGTSLDAYDASRGAYGGANVSSDATIAVNGGGACALTVGGTVSGDAWMGGDPATALCLGWAGSVSGATAALGAAVPMPLVAAPAAPASSGAYYLGWGEDDVWSADATFDSVLISSGAVRVDRSLTVVVLGDLAVDGGPIEVDAGAILDLYVSGNARFGWASAINVDGEPERVRLHLLGGDVQMDYGSALSAWTDTVGGNFANNGGAFYGTWVGSTLSSSWGASWHLDRSGLCP